MEEHTVGVFIMPACTLGIAIGILSASFCSYLVCPLIYDKAVK